MEPPMKRRRRIICLAVMTVLAVLIGWAVHVFSSNTPRYEPAARAAVSGSLAPASRPASGTPPDAPDLAASFGSTVLPFLQEYCYQCHGNGVQKGDLALDRFKTVADIK